MSVGYWINYKTGKVFRIDEHERWIRRWQNAKKLGVPEWLFEEFSEYEPVEDRDEFLIYVMEKIPVMRMRQHGIEYAFEFNTRRSKSALEAIYDFCQDYAGDYTALYIVNFATREVINMQYKDYREIMESGRTSDLMRAASETFKMRRGSQSLKSTFGKKAKELKKDKLK